MGRFKALILTLSLGFAIVGFQNCSQFAAKPAEAASGAPPVDSNGDGVTDDSLLDVTTSADFIYFNQTSQVTASGGTAPYTYALTSGDGSISSTSGLYTAPSTATTATITVTDGAGRTGIAIITVIDQTQGSTGSCDTIPVSTTAGCQGSRDSSCSREITFASKVSAGCKVKAIRLSARHFNGSATCALEAPLYFEASGTQVSGTTNAGYTHKKIASLTVDVDLDAKKMKLTSTAAGWGSCGGSPCNACISDISYELIQEPN